MKNKMFVVAGLMLASVGASAQNYFGVTAGYNLSNRFVTKYPGVCSYAENLPASGFNAGISYEHRFAPKANGGNWFLDASLLFSMEGFRSKCDGVFDYQGVVYDVSGDESYTWDETYHDKYLKLPVGVGFNFKCTDKFGFAPKVYGIVEKELDDDELGHGSSLLNFAFGGGVNLNIGERSQIGLGYEWNPQTGMGWYGNAHANFTYYIFSKSKSKTE